MSPADMYGADEIKDIRLGDVESRKYVDALGISQATVRALREKLVLIEVTVALWEAGAVELRKSANEWPAGSVTAKVRAQVCEAHAESIRDILNGE